MASSNFLIVFVSSTLAPGCCVFVPKIQPVLWHLCYDHLLLSVKRHQAMHRQYHFHPYENYVYTVSLPVALWAQDQTSTV
ncbi:hypothetical protein C8Q78DRAFT_1041407 [Trametes maxima]|nr:hypothetical protein C8Q78DRAFT_1041407 [Trametes maxima]